MAIPPITRGTQSAPKVNGAFMRRLPRRTMRHESPPEFRQSRAVPNRGGPGAMDHARPLPPDLVARYRAWQDRRTPEDIAAYAEAARQGPEPQGDDHHLLRQPGADLGDLRQRAGRLLHPPQHREPRAAARAGRPLARHLGGDRVRGDRAPDRPPDRHGPPRLRRRARLPRHAGRPRARPRHADELRRHLAEDPQARLRGARRPRPRLRGADRRRSRRRRCWSACAT